MNKCIALAALPVLSIAAFAQEISSPLSGIPDSVVIADDAKIRHDSIASVLNGILEDEYYDVSDNPLYFRLFMPVVLYGQAVSEAITPQEKKETSADDDLLPLEPIESESDMELSKMINETLLRIYMEHPELVKMTEQELMDVPSILPLADDAVAGVALKEGQVRGRRPDGNTPEPARVKISYWKTVGHFQGKYTQSYYSDNWYKGGESNHSILGQLDFDVNYAKKNTTFDNKLELKLGFHTTEIDGKKTFRTNEDLMRFTSKLGIKAWESWYFSSQFQGYTQFMPVYDTKVTTKLKSKFFAPVYGNLSVGMDFKPKLKRKNSSLSILLSPLSYNCRYVSVDSIAANYGIEQGKNYKYTIGSRFDGNIKWTFLEDFTWTSKAQYYTNYESAEINFENTLDYRFSRYFSLQFFCHWRFDDSVKRKKDKDGNLMGYSQFKEFLTLNFNYAW